VKAPLSGELCCGSCCTGCSGSKAAGDCGSESGGDRKPLVRTAVRRPAAKAEMGVDINGRADSWRGAGAGADAVAGSGAGSGVGAGFGAGSGIGAGPGPDADVGVRAGIDDAAATAVRNRSSAEGWRSRFGEIRRENPSVWSEGGGAAVASVGRGSRVSRIGRGDGAIRAGRATAGCLVGTDTGVCATLSVRPRDALP